MDTDLRKGGLTLTKGPARKVSIYINEDTQHLTNARHEPVIKFLTHKGVTGATATRAFPGFGSHQRLHTPELELLSCSLPLRIDALTSSMP